MSFWLFKCDPKLYRLTNRMADSNPIITWKVTRYQSEITSNDVVFLMETGDNRAIRAVIRVDEAPAEIGELESEQQYLVERDTATRCRVRGTITHRCHLRVNEFDAVSGLENLCLFHGVQRGTNFRVSNEEGRILLSLTQPESD